MTDPRVKNLADMLCSYSMELSSKDTLLIHTFDMPMPVITQFVKSAQQTGAKVTVRIEDSSVRRQLLHGMAQEGAKIASDIQLSEMEHMTAYLALRGAHNISEFSDVPSENMEAWNKAYRTVLDHRVNKTKWVVLRWPLSSMAQLASMSTEAFEDFYFRVCTLDYKKMSDATLPLKELMDKTDQVHLVGPGTDLKFSIKDIGSEPCVGHRNIPDGECYSCPVKDSVEGVVQYNTTTVYRDVTFKNVRFVVKKGKIVEATADTNTDKLNEILDSDEGARYFGEWSLGYNPFILHPMMDTLFDEKIAGSFHLTPGQAYEDVGNGNKSSIHWDIVCIQRPEYGGGEVWFDGKLIRKDGLFVLPELQGLNPENLSKSF